MSLWTPSTFDGHPINDGNNYVAYPVGNDLDTATGDPIVADVNFSFGRFVGVKKTSRDFSLLIDVKAGAPAALETRRNELAQWFSPYVGEKYLVGTFPNAPAARRLACIPLGVEWVGAHVARVNLRALRPLWENDTEAQVAWTATTSGETKTVTNPGNANVAPTFRVQLTNTPLNGYRWKRPVIVRNRIGSRLLNYPLEITGDTAWDTAALVANVSKACQVNGALSDSATTIPCDTPGTAAFYATGWIVIGAEQIYYAGKTDTSFTGCLRGVNGTTAAAHADDAAIYQSEMAADGSDIAIEIDGVDVERWFGGAPGATGGPNSVDTKVWVNFPDIPAKPTTDYDSVYATLGSDLGQLYGTATASTAKAEGGGAAAVLLADDMAHPLNYRWQANGVVPQWVQVDLGAARVVSAVRLQMSANEPNRPRSFEIRATNDSYWATYEVIQAVTNAPNADNGTAEWLTYTFPAETYRYWRIYITAVRGGASDAPWLHRFRLYNAQANAYVKYGNPTVSLPAGNVARQPMFDLADSLNSKWVYSQFYNYDYPLRPQQWKPVLLGTSKQEQRVYYQQQDGGGGYVIKDQYYEAGNDWTQPLTGDGQSFIPSITGILNSVELYLVPSSEGWILTCDIYSIVGDTFTKLGEIGNTLILITEGWYTFNRVGSQASIYLTAGGTYMIVARALNQGVAFPPDLACDQSSPTYTNGSRFVNWGDFWTPDEGRDFLFRVNIVVGRPNILGVAAKTFDTTQFLNAWAFSHPCGISNVIYSGNTKQYPASRRLDLIAVDANNNRKTIHSVTDDTHAAWDDFGPLTYPLSPAAITIYFAHTWLASTTADNYGEVTDAELTISVPPTVEFQAAQETSSVKFKLENTTTGQSILVAGLLPLDTAVDIDCEAHRVAEVLSGAEHASFVSADAVRDFWLELAPGANTLQLTDEAVTGLSIETRYRARWI